MNKKEVQQVLKGFRDFLPEEKRKRDFVVNKIKSTFELFGFIPLETPTLESADLLMGKYGDEADKLLYTFEDRGDRKIGLKYDQTVPTARVLSNYKHTLPKYFRRYQIQNVFRAEKPQKGRYRELTQCDVDIFGTNQVVSDVDVLACIYRTLENIGFKNIEIWINDRSILIDTLTPYATNDVSVLSIIQTIDKLDKKDKNDVVIELVSKGLSKDSAEDALESIYAAKATDSLSKIIDLVKESGIPASSLVFKPMLARGLDYYTGMIFEVKLVGSTTLSLAGGGRYDNLIESISGEKIPAVGGAFGFDRVVEAAGDLGLIDFANADNFFVTVFSSELERESINVVNEIRKLGKIGEIYVGDNYDLGKQFKYADKLKYRYVVIIGDDEVANNSLTIKDFNTGESKTIKREDLNKY